MVFIGAQVRGWYEWHRPMAVFAATMAVLIVVATVGVLVNDRYLAGAPVAQAVEIRDLVPGLRGVAGLGAGPDAR
ncbi:hypothetical protein GCM10011609_87860 [Lentzea pudingi]|uniref:Uncharacterized protein n=1 Tax=Lentzea pudingi TaxID=1789439 RepID=A0ABQ2IXF9_9PSEU|nr:hypothetical protein GCM10011609_87860 [Lentzea pudingi]